jgi:VanZ family protein
VNSDSTSRPFPRREWAAALLWVTLIAIESTPWLSSQNTGHALYQLLASVFGPMDSSLVTLVNTALRETGHVTGYGVLSWLLFRAWRASFRSSGVAAWAFTWSVAAFLLTAGVASLDEFHQTFLPSRTGSIHDVYLDSAAALAVQILLFVFLRKRRPGRVPEESPVTVGD